MTHCFLASFNVAVSSEQGLSIKVIDQGVGLDSLEEQSRGKSKFGSTGLGLSFVKRVVEEHGGKFSISSIDRMTIAELRIQR